MMTNMMSGYTLSWFYIMLFLRFFICRLLNAYQVHLGRDTNCLPSEKPKLYYRTLGIVSELSCSLDIRIGYISQPIPFNFPKLWMFVQCFLYMHIITMTQLKYT